MSETNASRASMDVRHIKHGDGARSNSRGLLRESMRELDQTSWTYYSQVNPNVDSSKTHLNESFVNDGQGGWERATSIDEVVAYADTRRPRTDGVREPGRVYRKLSDASFELTTIVMHLPRSLCQEEEWVDNDGRRKARWVANDMAEARQYFADALAHLEDEVLVGGHDAIHGYAENWDEHTPHIQIQCDPFADDPKHPGYLKTYATEMWGTAKTPKGLTSGDRSGKKTGPEKMRDYHAGLRERMIELGYDVEAAPSDRSREHEHKESWAKAQQHIDANYEKAQQEQDEARARLEAAAERESELPELRRQAIEDGKAQGLAEAKSAIAAEVDRLVAESLGPARDALDRKRAELNEEQERGRAELRDQKAKMLALIADANHKIAMAQVAQEQYTASANKYHELTARLEPAVLKWEQLNPATAKGKAAQRNIAAVERIRMAAAAIEDTHEVDDAQFD